MLPISIPLQLINHLSSTSIVHLGIGLAELKNQHKILLPPLILVTIVTSSLPATRPFASTVSKLKDEWRMLKQLYIGCPF